MVGDFINTVKTTFNFDLNQAVKHHGYTLTHNIKDKSSSCRFKSCYLITFKLVIRKNLDCFKTQNKWWLGCIDIIARHCIKTEKLFRFYFQANLMFERTELVLLTSKFFTNWHVVYGCSDSLKRHITLDFVFLKI